MYATDCHDDFMLRAGRFFFSLVFSFAEFQVMTCGLDVIGQTAMHRVHYDWMRSELHIFFVPIA